MKGRPPSSARPSTSTRPTTAFDRDQFQQRLQEQPYEIEEEYEEESDEEDVFAFLPPTTADQERQESISQSPFTFAAHSNNLQYPEPSFDPWGRQYPNVAAPSTDPNAYISPSISPPAQAGSPHSFPPGIHSVAYPHPYSYPHPSSFPPSPSIDSHPSTGIAGPDSIHLNEVAKDTERGPDNTNKADSDADTDADADDSDNADKHKEPYDSDVTSSEKDENNNISSSDQRHTTSSHHFQPVHIPTYPHDADTERDAGLFRPSISTTIASASKGTTERGITVLGSGKGTKPNVNAQPYRMYNQQASSYYGRDVRTSSGASATGVALQNIRTTRVSLSAQSSCQHGAGPSHQHNGGMGIPEAPSSLADSLSFTQSMADDDESPSIKIEFDFDAIEEEDSPFPEVRASVSNIDDPEMPAMTARMWFIGLFLCIISGALNVFFNFRNPAPSIVPLALLLVAYPFGKILAFTLPITTYRIPLPYLPRFIFPINQPSFAPFRLIVNLFLPLTYPRVIELSLNPGPWNIKEHVLVYIMANVAVGAPYALNAIVVSEVYYGIPMGYWFSLTLVFATQLTGFGLAGLCRRFLVWPASMIWPQNLVVCTLLNTLHAEDEDDGIGMYGGTPGSGRKGMSRHKFFMIALVSSFFFFFLPGYLFEALSVFSFVCWAAPTNVPVNQLFGVRSGLGMSIITFDWSQISWIGSPLMIPWWAEMHVLVGFVAFFWILTPILYYTNSWNMAYFPISANYPYDRFGQLYNISRVLLADDTFDEAAYFAYSPLYLPATYAMTYLLAFALSTCVLVHTALYHGKTLVNGFKRIRVEPDDIHAKLMRNYPEVPEWWYATAFCFFFSIAVIAVERWHTGVPVWALLLSVLLPIIYILPSGFIYAMTGAGISINILAQIIPGTLIPGKPIANMIFKAYSVETLSAGSSFLQDLKLGHYVKVPPRATFIVQMVATILSAFIQVGVKEWLFANVPDICQADQVSSLTCPHNQVFYTASAVWGLIGPTRQFGTGSVYHPHLYSLAVGVFLPIPFWLWQRRYPNSWVRFVNTPVLIAGLGSIPPATGINYSSWFLVAFIFQYLIRKRNFAWWSKFNYVLSAAMDSGTCLSIIFIFLTLQFPNGGVEVNWWGNSVFLSTADWNHTALLTVPAGGLPFYKN